MSTANKDLSILCWASFDSSKKEGFLTHRQALVRETLAVIIIDQEGQKGQLVVSVYFCCKSGVCVP